ncbi:MAG: type II CRISPR RNA-guided endonuclease Cas9, partial [Bacteroidaceae bacterium]|nr:type II CRISPR RNA-guided endonuclease Cas9 [Bacteroidaceae bacterium]
MEHLTSALKKELLPEDSSLLMFPSIYHLRNHLVKTNEKVDIRLVYLAIHHIIKYRGNFLFEDLDIVNISSGSNTRDILKEAIDKTNGLLNTTLNSDLLVLSGIMDKLSNAQMSRKEKSEFIAKLLTSDTADKKTAVAFSNAITGLKFKIADLLDAEDEKKSIRFSDEPDYDELGLDDEEILALELLKNVYSWQLCCTLLGNGENYSDIDGEKNISAAIVQRYEKHSKDLKILKAFVKGFFKDKYNLVFRVNKPKLNNYSAYVKNDNSYIEKCSREDFYEFLKKELLNGIENEEIKLSEEYNHIIQEIEKDSFLPLLRTKDNGVIPYQFHKYELEQIINRQGKYYPSLSKNGDKILNICSFRIPYYVGPLNSTSDFAWLERKPGEIYPWNFEEQVSLLDSAEEFITRMTNHCTYFKNEYVLPKHSLLYEEFMLLNRLNKLTINGEPFEKRLSALVKIRLVNELFKTEKNVKPVDIEKWISSNTVLGPDVKIGGLPEDNKLDVSCGSYYDMKKIFGVIDEKNIKAMEKYENIIKWVTLFKDKSILRKKIEKAYPDIKKDDIEKICKLNYSGWGRISESFLRHRVTYKNSTMQIVDVLRSSFMNLNQILAYKAFDLENAIAQHHIEGSLEESIDSMITSPSVKRSTREVIKIIDEIRTVIGHDPTDIFLEFAREKQKRPKRTKSRFDRLTDLYESNEITKDVKEELVKLKSEKTRLDDDRILLYFLQLGKCMYTGEDLNIDLLQTYQIDHIIPRSAIKDDSLDNRVLVKHTANQYKADSLLLKAEVRRERSAFWHHLYDLKLLSFKKLSNLLRSEINESDLERFINRQLVETRQIAKNVKSLLEEYYPKPKITAVHARLLTDAREKYELYKIRNLNDYHHAYDAFLACIMGRFSNLLLLGTIDDPYRTYRMFINSKSIRKSNYGFVLGSFENGLVDIDTGEVIFDHETTVRYMKEA